MIEIRGLKKSFGSKLIFSNVNMTIPDGKWVGLYGPSGIGKSTLAKLLCGVLRPDEGEIRLNGKPLVSVGKSYDRRAGLAIQMVYQQPHASLDGAQKIGAGLRELIAYHHFAGSRADTDALIDSLLEDVGVDREILCHLPHQISGGEAQRVAIARCLLFQPKLLILDEATSMLDVSTQANVIALVRRVAERVGGSVLLISHDRELVEYLCDHIYFMENQQIKEELPL